MTSLLASAQKYFLLAILLLVSFLFFYLRLYEYLTLPMLKKYQLVAEVWTHQHYFVSVTIYTALLTVLIACAIPCATFFALVGGLLFGVLAILYAEIGTTLGGFMLYIAVKTAIGSRLSHTSRGWIKTMEQGFKENAFNYLLSLRLMPIFPCWISNISAGVLNVPINTFLLATALGLLPSNIIYVLAGRSLDTLLTDDTVPLSQLILTPSVLFPLIGLALISLFPIIYKTIKKYKKTR